MPKTIADAKKAEIAAQAAFDYSSNAVIAAGQCDKMRVERLEKWAKKKIKEALHHLKNIPKKILDKTHFDELAKRNIGNAKKNLAKIADELKKACAIKRKEVNTTCNGGTFKGTKDGIQSPRGEKNKIEFVFTLKPGIKCEQLAIVSVMHIEEDDTGRTVIPPSKAFLDTYDPLPGGRLRDIDSIGGFTVDVAPLKLENGKLVINKNPSSSSMEIKGNTITAEDDPRFLKPGYTAYFETCVLCLDDDKFKYLGCIRWWHRPGESRIEKDKNGNIDQKEASWMNVWAMWAWYFTHG